MTTPGEILSNYLRNTGTDEFTVEAIDPDIGLSYRCTDLGNGNMVYGFVSQMTDGVYATPGSPIDLASCNFGDWDNLSAQYTGQYGGGDSMHDSEYVGGRLAEDMASTPGEYATPYITWYCDEDCDCEGDGVLPGGDYCELDIEGWLVLYRDIFSN